MYVIFYDYDDDRVRGRVMNNLKRLGVHAQWSVFEVDLPLEKIKDALILSGEVYRVGIFRVSRGAKIIRLGRIWEARPKRVF